MRATKKNTFAFAAGMHAFVFFPVCFFAKVRSFYNPSSGWWITDASKAGYHLLRKPANDTIAQGELGSVLPSFLLLLPLFLLVLVLVLVLVLLLLLLLLLLFFYRVGVGVGVAASCVVAVARDTIYTTHPLFSFARLYKLR